MKPPRANLYRDAWSGTVDRLRIGDEVRVAGWVHRRRDHGGLVFIDLRDRSGLLQLVFHPESAPEAHATAHRLRSEHVISARGAVVEREAGNVNPNLPTGEVEVHVAELEVLAESDTPPFPIDEEGPLDEGLRIKHRPLDLRRAQMQRSLALRHTIVTTMREALNERDFLEIETPDLTRSTPEGARDFLVPVRNPPGSFWALPQSPQLFKQLLMIAGYERYYQIARCFRDEDSRADRAPEFTQLDMEMSFVGEDDVIEATEATMAAVFAAADFEAPAPPWRRIPYPEAMLRYGSDKPDLRFGLEIVDLGEALRGSEFKVFSGALDSGGVVRGLNAGALEAPRSELDELTELAKKEGAKGLVWAFVEEGGTWRSPIAKFLSGDEIAAVTQRLGGRPGDLLLLVADAAGVAAETLGGLRVALRDRHDLVPADAAHQIFWVVDFPMFAWNADERRWDAIHHPFTAPLGDLDDPASLTSRSYDLVLDGHEIGGGSIRISSLEVQQKVFELLGIDAEQAQARFGFLLDALRY
ncbi:MAG: aspartyl-tRNA synthetase, partial [Solirubrobacterales bacterium]|nr:aspartyl-tRNA synthetase [Solirubrobacterales bacterium]